MKLKVLCYMLCAFGLHILPAFCEGNVRVTTTQSPLIIKLSYSIIKTYTILPPGVNRATIEVLTQKVILQTNSYTGIWQRPDDTNTTDDKIEFPIFTVKFNGLYRFYRTYQNGSQLLGIQIYISVSGTNFAQVLSNGEYALLSGNNIFYSDTTLVCATNDTFQHIQWQHKGIGELNYTDILDSAFNSTIGISELKLSTTRQGYYRCTVMTVGTTYAVGIFNKEVTRKVLSSTNFGHYTKQVDSQEVQLLCISNNLSIPLKDIVWNEPGNTLQNPLILNTLKIGYHTLTCKGTNENIKVTVTIQGPPNITLSTSDNIFDILPDSINILYVPVLTQNVLIQANLIGKWQFPDTTNNSNSTILISYFTANHVGIYSFYVIGWDSTELLAIRISIYATGTSFGEIMSQKIYKILSSYTLFNSSKTLFCATNDTSQQIQWTHQSNLDTNIDDVTESSIRDYTTGISTLDIATSQQGYYTCIISEGTSYTVGIFNPDITIEIRKGSTRDSYVYTRGIDPSGLQLLCVSDDTNIAFSKINWFSSIMLSQNPLILDSLPNMDGDLLCYIEGPKIIIIRQLIQGPPTIMLSNTTQANFSSLLSNANTATLRVLTQNVTLHTNLIGMWHRPDSTVISDNTFTYSVFTANLAGLYTFNVSDWKGNQVIAIAITISATGSNFAEKLPSGDFRILSGNNIFYTANTLVCVTNDTSHEIQWTYQPRQDATDVIKTADAIWNADTGISELFITTTEQGYYECEIMSEGSTYTTAIFNPDITIVATERFYYYIKGIDPTNIQILCDPKDTTVALSSIKLEYSGSEFNNPLIINEAGSTSGQVICEFGSSRFGFILTIQEPSLTFTYTGYAMQYNTLSPSTTPITIPLLSTQVTLIINDIVSGTWSIPRNTSEGTTLEIPIFTLVSTGRYTFNSADTWDGMEKQVFIIDISPIGDAFALMDSVNTYAVQSNNPFFYTDTTLVCLTDYETQVNWYYRVRTQADKHVTATLNTDTNGISTYKAMISQPGFYSCEGINYGSAYTYTAGVFNANNTRVAVEGASYFYTIGIDREEAELLCNPMDSSVDLNTVQWFRKDVHTNPLELSKNIHPLALGTSEIHCFVPTITDIRLTANLTIQNQPVIEVAYLEESTSSTLYQYVPIIIPLLINNTVISSNLVNGIWRFTYSNDITNYGNNTEYRVNLFTANNIGVYEYTFANFYEDEEIIQVNLEGTGYALGIEIDSRIITVGNNTIFYQDTLTLIAASNKRQLERNDIMWSQQDELMDSQIQHISGSIIDSTLSISRLNVDSLPNGYYTVLIKDSISMTEQFVVGVFKPTNIYDTRRIKHINYTSGIDSNEQQILCIPQNPPVLADIRWKFGANVLFPNPVKLEVISLELDTANNAMLICTDITDDRIEYERIQVVFDRAFTITLSYLNIISVFTGNNIIFEIEIFTRNVQLECNREFCTWQEIDSLGIETIVGKNRSYTIPYITIENYKLYVLKTEDNTGAIVSKVSIKITPIGTTLQRLTIDGTKEIYEKLNTNFIIMIEESVSLVCVTSYESATEQDIEWYFQETVLSNVVVITGDFNERLGLSILTINKPGYYSCSVSDHTQIKYNYTIGIVDYSIDTREVYLSDLQSSQKINFVAGQGLKLLFQNESIPIQSIRWAIGEETAYTTSFLIEYFNPVNISEVFNDFGSGTYTLFCFYRQSPITNVGKMRINLKDTASLIVQYGQVQSIFSDEENINFPKPENISIPITTKNVNISCSLKSCVGMIEKNGESITTLFIASLRIENAGVYDLRRTTDLEVNYTTASFFLHVTGYMDQSIVNINSSIINEISVHIYWVLQNQLPINAQETFNITYHQSGKSLIQSGLTTDRSYIITNLSAGINYTIWVELSYAYTHRTSIISIQVTIPKERVDLPFVPLYMIAVIVPIMFIILLCCCISFILLLRRIKRHSFETLETDKYTEKSSRDLGYNPLSLKIDNPVFNPEIIESTADNSQIRESSNYMTIDETSIAPLEIEGIDAGDPYYSNFARKPITKRQYELLKQDKTKEYAVLGENVPYEEYTPMYSIQNKLEFLTKAISSKEFPSTYKQYVESGIGQDSLFKKEFDLLNEDLEQKPLSSSQKENNIIPFDENRVVLNSPSIDSDYINASWMESYQFIATIHPTRDTLQYFLQMLYQTETSMVIMLTTRREKAKIISGISKRVCYWSREIGESLNCEPFVSSLISSTETTAFVKQEISLRNTLEGKNHSFTHCISSIWNEDSTVIEMSWAMVLLNRIIKQKQDFPKAPIVLHCEDGISKTGIILALTNTVNELNYRKTINIFHSVKSLRKQRMQMIPTLACYTTCYSLMNEYCSIHL